MESAAAKPTFVDYGQFSGRSGELAVLMDISGAQLPSMPVVVAFELDGSALREYLLPENIADAAVYVLSAVGHAAFQRRQCGCAVSPHLRCESNGVSRRIPDSSPRKPFRAAVSAAAAKQSGKSGDQGSF